MRLCPACLLSALLLAACPILACEGSVGEERAGSADASGPGEAETDAGALRVDSGAVILEDAGPAPVPDAGRPADAAPECTPNCTDRTCGDDGCGGECGACAMAETCSRGACVADPLYQHHMVTGQVHVEGPAVTPDGRVIAVNFMRRGTLGIFTPTGPLAEPMGTPELLVDLGRHNCNGTRVLSDGRTAVCISVSTGHLVRVDIDDRRVLGSVPVAPGASPNDVAVLGDDTVFVTGPNSGNVYRVADGGRGAVTTVAHVNGTKPNGIDVSPDETRLYFNGWDFSSAHRNRLFVAPLDGGEVGEPEVLVDFGASCIPDGIRTDLDGNLYMACTAGGRRVLKIRPDGTIEREIPTVLGGTTNVTFGGGRRSDALRHPARGWSGRRGSVPSPGPWARLVVAPVKESLLYLTTRVQGPDTGRKAPSLARGLAGRPYRPPARRRRLRSSRRWSWIHLAPCPSR